jgi:hypothetical protein
VEDTIRQHLDDSWPTDDEAEDQLTGKKRVSEWKHPKAKSQKLPDGSGSRVPSDDGQGD